jgi:hypothetical protein
MKDYDYNMAIYGEVFTDDHGNIIDNQDIQSYHADLEHDKRKDNRLEEIYGAREPSK